MKQLCIRAEDIHHFAREKAARDNPLHPATANLFSQSAFTKSNEAKSTQCIFKTE